MPASDAVTTHRLFENLEINWEAFCSGPGPSLAPDPGEQWGRLSLGNFRDEHLRSRLALERLHALAVTRGAIGDSEADHFRFLATVAYCLRTGGRPAALLRYLIGRREFPATLEEEDRALDPVRRDRREGVRLLRYKIERGGADDPGGPTQRTGGDLKRP